MRENKEMAESRVYEYYPPILMGEETKQQKYNDDLELGLLLYCIKHWGKWWANRWFYNDEVTMYYRRIRQLDAGTVITIVQCGCIEYTRHMEQWKSVQERMGRALEEDEQYLDGEQARLKTELIATQKKLLRLYAKDSDRKEEMLRLQRKIIKNQEAIARIQESRHKYMKELLDKKDIKDAMDKVGT